MKKLLLIAVGILSAVSAYSQGTVLFNTKTTGVDAPVTLSTGGKAMGPQYVGQLYAGASASALAPVGSAVPFRSDAGAGYITGGGSVVVPGIAGGSPASVQLRAWDSTQGSYDAATSKGSSAAITVNLGGAGNPPGLPANLTGLSGFAINVAGPGNVPEPSTIALAALGGAAALFLRRRK
jgi:hypothetical protein